MKSCSRTTHSRRPSTRAGKVISAAKHQLDKREFDNPHSGRLDAGEFASFLGITLDQLAGALQVSAPSLHQAPDAPSLQTRLKVLLRIVTSLTRLFGSAANARVWLKSPHPALDKTRPMYLIKTGKAEIVAEMLEDALLGHPN